MILQSCSSRGTVPIGVQCHRVVDLWIQVLEAVLRFLKWVVRLLLWLQLHLGVVLYSLRGRPKRDESLLEKLLHSC